MRIELPFCYSSSHLPMLQRAPNSTLQQDSADRVPAAVMLSLA